MFCFLLDEQAQPSVSTSDRVEGDGSNALLSSRTDQKTTTVRQRIWFTKDSQTHITNSKTNNCSVSLKKKERKVCVKGGQSSDSFQINGRLLLQMAH